MKIVYMGTPDFAVPALDKLAQSKYKPILVVSQPDAKRDRGEQVKPTPVKVKALEWGIPVEQPERIRGNADFIEMLRKLQPDLIIVAAYGKILPLELLQIPTKGCVNIHASLLPKYRGAAPVQRAILKGDAQTGVTLMQMAEGMDTGDILATTATPIAEKTTGMLLEELAEMGAQLLMEHLPKIFENQMIPIPQNNQEATYAPMIFKKDGLIDFSKPAIEIQRQIRAMDPWPGAFTVFAGQTIKIWQAEVTEEISKEPQGTITGISPRGITVSTGQGLLHITELQMPGKKKMPVSAYIRGNHIEINSVLG
jgi:methionyl-tRNA formyltransferase